MTFPAFLARMCRATPKTDGFAEFKLPNGMHFQLSLNTRDPDAYHQAVLSGATFDAPWRFLVSWLHSGDVLFDLGANIGTISIPAAASGVQVHAFEMLASNVRHILRAEARNGITGIKVIQGAVSDRNELVGIANDSAWGTTVPDAQVLVPTMTIDAYVSQRNIGHVGTMKMDIEGSERNALRGAAGLIERDHPDIVIEANVVTCGNHGYSYQELLNFLEGHGYRVFRILADRLCPYRKGSIQEVVYTDYIGTTKSDEEIIDRSGWKISPISNQDIIESIKHQSDMPDLHKQYVRVIANSLPIDALSDTGVAALLAQWEHLDDPAVKDVLALGAGLPSARK